MQRQGRGVIENAHSTDVGYPPPPPRVYMSNHTQHKPCIAVGRVLVLDDVESPPPPPRVCMSNHTKGKPCSDPGRVLVLDDPATRAS